MLTATDPRRAVSHRDELAVELAGHLRTPPGRGQPIVIKNPIGRSGMWSCTILWDRWTGLPSRDRSEIIREANDALDGATKVDLGTATGMTTEEAITLGYLPFGIQPMCKLSDAVSEVEIREAMVAEGAVETSRGLQLRFISMDDARESYMRLQEALPGPFWSIVEEVVREF